MRQENLLWLIIIILIILWIGGFSLQIGGLIHVLLVVALILIVYRLVTGRRPRL